MQGFAMAAGLLLFQPTGSDAAAQDAVETLEAAESNADVVVTPYSQSFKLFQRHCLEPMETTGRWSAPSDWRSIPAPNLASHLPGEPEQFTAYGLQDKDETYILLTATGAGANVHARAIYTFCSLIVKGAPSTTWVRRELLNYTGVAAHPSLVSKSGERTSRAWATWRADGRFAWRDLHALQVTDPSYYTFGPGSSKDFVMLEETELEDANTHALTLVVYKNRKRFRQSAHPLTPAPSPQ